MNPYPKYTEICICHNCGCRLHYEPFYQNIYSGGPFYCGNCNKDVSEDIYGKDFKKKNKKEKS